MSIAYHLFYSIVVDPREPPESGLTLKEASEAASSRVTGLTIPSLIAGSATSDLQSRRIDICAHHKGSFVLRAGILSWLIWLCWIRWKPREKDGASAVLVRCGLFCCVILIMIKMAEDCHMNVTLVECEGDLGKIGMSLYLSLLRWNGPGSRTWRMKEALSAHRRCRENRRKHSKSFSSKRGGLRERRIENL